MKECLKILEFHYKCYPMMRCEDAVKLLYQGEFGGGHMITDENASLLQLQDEYANICSDVSQPLTEPLGNNIVRVNLQALHQCGISIDVLNRIFVESANTIHGSIDSFKEKLSLLIYVKHKLGFFAFSGEALADYISGYEKAGFPVVSHSALYRRMYSPAYRVVKENLLIEKLKASQHQNESF